MSDGLEAAARRASDWSKRYALPIWTDAGFAAGPDYFHEALDFSGAPLVELPLRSRVQGRQMYVCGHATVLGWFDGREILARCFQRGYAWFQHPDGGYVASITPDGAHLDRTRFAYEQAFALLGFAWHERVFRNGEAAARAETLWRWLEENLAAPVAEGFAMAVPPDSGPRSQNPHMHLFETCMVWHETLPDGLWLERARKLYDLFVRHFFDAKHGVLREFFADDLSPTVPQSRHIEPGHQAEWVWLLNAWRKLTGTATTDAAAALHRFAEAHGINPGTGLFFDAVDIGGKPTSTSSRLWTATEMLKAEIARYEASGFTSPTDKIEGAVGLIFDRHLDGVKPGLWMDRLSVEGEPAATNVPASTLYHLFLAFADLSRVADHP
jgi:mannose/cellobiose epimerase-like protein (N-acyl-D-glucosamine 2-epimerase family)